MAADEFVFERFGPVACGVPGDNEKYIVAVAGAAITEVRDMVRRPEVRHDLLPLLSPEEVQRRAVQHAKDLLEDDDEPQLDPLFRAVAGAPVLVQRLDRTDDYYFIVPFEFQGQITSRMIVDAKTGKLKEVQWIEDAQASLPPWHKPAEFVRRYQGQPIPAREPSARIVRPENTGVHPTLVWQPCPESRSPFAPFALMTVGDERVYQKVDDGTVFRRLSNTGKGR
jgi:hypothetical protein